MLRGEDLGLDRGSFQIYVPVMFTSAQQIWDASVARNTLALKLVVVELIGLLGAYGGMEAVRVPRVVRSIMLRVLRPAEAALRRLIVIAARDVRVDFLPRKTKPLQFITGERLPRTSTCRALSRMAFPLIDPLRRVGQRHIAYTDSNPRVFVVEAAAPFSPLSQIPVSRLQQETENLAGVTRICRRLGALVAALEDVPRQAKRLARLRVLRENRKLYFSPLRLGKPPGFRKNPIDDVDYILAECHDHARAVLAFPNTS